MKLYENDIYSYKIELEARFLEMILDEKLTWEQLLLSLRYNAVREPDVFNEHFIVFLRFACIDSFKSYERFEKEKNMSEMFDLEVEDQKYSVQKYCPHAMGDLSEGKIEEGCIVCPNHGWRFKLENGKCLTNKTSIKVKMRDN